MSPCLYQLSGSRTGCKQASRHRVETQRWKAHRYGLGLERRPCIQLQRPLNTVSSATDESPQGPLLAVKWKVYRDPTGHFFLSWSLSLKGWPRCHSAAIDTVTYATENRSMGNRVMASLRGDWLPSHQGLLAPGLGLGPRSAHLCTRASGPTFRFPCPQGAYSPVGRDRCSCKA